MAHIQFGWLNMPRNTNNVKNTKKEFGVCSKVYVWRNTCALFLKIL